MVSNIPLVQEKGVIYVKVKFLLELAQYLMKIANDPKKINKIANSLIDTYIQISDKQEQIDEEVRSSVKSKKGSSVGFQVSDNAVEDEDDDYED